MSNKRAYRNSYYRWSNMIRRCHDKSFHSYGNYGARGIKVCKRWHVFEKFYEDMGNAPPGKSLDRIDNNQGYYLENCRWATIQEQVNNRRITKKYEMNGTIKSSNDWAREYGLPIEVVRDRLKRGNSIEAALKNPVNKFKSELIYKGVTYTYGELSEKFKVGYMTLYQRLYKGMSLEEALTKPVRAKRKART